MPFGLPANSRRRPLFRPVLRHLKKHQCVLAHCEHGFKQTVLAPLEPDGEISSWGQRELVLIRCSRHDQRLFRFTVLLASALWRIHAVVARENLSFHCGVAGQRVKRFLARFPSAVHLDPLTVSWTAARILRAGVLPPNSINQPTIFSTRDIALHIMVFSPRIGRSRMTAGRSKIARIWQQPVKRPDLDGIQRIAGAEAAVVSCDEFTRKLDPKGFWRVDKERELELRHTVLSLVAFHDLQRLGLEAFLNQNNGDGWTLPATLRLADYGLGHDDRAREPQPVAVWLGERFYPWQLEGTVEESWEECRRHAENLRLIRAIGTPTPTPAVPTTHRLKPGFQSPPRRICWGHRLHRIYLGMRCRLARAVVGKILLLCLLLPQSTRNSSNGLASCQHGRTRHSVAF